MSTAPIFVCVCENDLAHPRWGLDHQGPLVCETYTREATREAAEARAAHMSQYGRCRIGRVVFDDEISTGGEAATSSITTQDQQ